MATIELVNVSKTLKGDDTSLVLESSVLGRLYREARDIESPVTESNREGPFSMQNLNLFVPDGKTMVLLGPSGCGKTTLLRLIAGLIKPDSGQIRFDGVDMESILPGERGIGMVFQNYALYPHMTSKGNILSYFLFRTKTPELDGLAKERFRRTSELMGVDIAYLLNKKPVNLSAGEKQRVALGRCITRDPKIFLLDEPFSNLDQQLREKYRVNLKSLLSHFGITTLYVTHDQQEALILADLIAIMDVGTVEQVGTYEEIYTSPKTVLVAGFLNLNTDTPAINLIDGRSISEELQDTVVGVRPEDVAISEEMHDISVRGCIRQIINIPIKGATIFTAEVGEEQVYGRIPKTEDLSAGTDVRLGFNRYHVFDKATQLRVRSHPQD